MNAKKYLEDMGIDIKRFIEIPTDNEATGKAIMLSDLLEEYHETKVKNLGLFGVTKRSELLSFIREKNRY